MIELLNNSETGNSTYLRWNCRSVRTGGVVRSFTRFRWNGVSLALVNFVAGTFSICFNSLVLFVIFKNKNLRSVSHILAAMLSAVDIFAALCQMNTAVIHSYLAFDVKSVHTTWYCEMLRAEIFLNVIVLIVSVTIIFGITCERYIAVLYPIFYKSNKRTTFKGIAAVLVVFATSMVLGKSRIHVEVGSTIFFLTIISIFLFCFYAYVRIYIKLRISTRRVAIENLANIARQKKRFITSLMVILVFLACYFPVIIMGSVIGRRSGKNGSLSLYFQPWIRSFFYISSSANPFVYCLRNSRLSPIIMTYIKKCFGARRKAARQYREEEVGPYY